ncbi:amidohydrolase family protein [Actinophytocola oryzae]|uniref:Putative amidohydrolase YtcJ n=1 Tax=Actinophytocola oryzae TaxID=502181 RepID=A0A4R7VL19_9PSEU|nr:amidohydrolase family protein [Actinophytocola oryzae]TDV49879.1 putative amidohydrolase YtcJ [Actinophytocola oryzae]
MTGLLIRDAELYGIGRGDCRVRNGTIAEVGRGLRPAPDDRVLDGAGGALLPGLADHHLHLAACAAPATDFPALAHAAPGTDGWLRVTGYDDVRHGPLDRDTLDRLRGEVPLRVQHRSGALWVVNSAGLDRLGAATATHPGIERDHTGRPTGRLWRADAWVRSVLGATVPDLAPLGRRLAAFGITHVTDATPGADPADLVLPQHVLALGTRKLVVSDHHLPTLDELAEQIREVHARGGPVAVHCVTRVALVLTIAAIDLAGGLPGDRIEHCAVADAALAGELARRGLRVVTQPTLVSLRGDDYHDRVEPEDRQDLWPYATLLRAGVRVAPSSDAPYGDPDPWACLRAAAGRELGPHERVPVEVALRGMLSPLTDPGGPPRRITRGAPADLVLLDRPVAEVLTATVRTTIISGEPAHEP